MNMFNMDSERMSLGMKSLDSSSVHMTGQSIDRIYKNGVLIEEVVSHNLVVNSFLTLVMCLLTHRSGFKGIQYWAIGEGDSSWDSSMPEPSLSDTLLNNEIGRVPISLDDVKFLNPQHEVVSYPTNIIQVSHTFGTDECNGVWREFGIFGGNATSNLNSGYMINKRHHKVITKTNEMTVERVMRFTLTLV